MAKEKDSPAKVVEKKPDPRAERATPAPRAGTEEVVVAGRPLTAGSGAAPGKAKVVEPDVTEDTPGGKKQLEGTTVVKVKAVTDDGQGFSGYYGHKLRRTGEVFEMRVGKGDLPAWVEKASKGDEGTPNVPEVPRRKDDKDTVNDLLNAAGLDAAGNVKAKDDDQVL